MTGHTPWRELKHKTKPSFYIVYLPDHDDPVPLVGPYLSRDAALEAYLARMIEAGYDIEEGVTAEDLYLTDDAVRIGRVG